MPKLINNAMSEKIMNTTILGLSVSTWTVIIAFIGFFIYQRADVDYLKQGQASAKAEREKILAEFDEYKLQQEERRKEDRAETRELLKEIKQSLYELRQEFKEYNR